MCPAQISRAEESPSQHPRRVSVLVLLTLCIMSAGGFYVAHAGDVIDPLGNVVLSGSGTPLYSIGATYGLFEGESVIRREKQFKEKFKAHYFTLDVGGDSLRHQFTVGRFPIKFSSFTLNNDFSDAVRWSIFSPNRDGNTNRGGITGFLARTTNNTFANNNPIIDRDIVGTADWFMAGVRADANLGSWEVELAGLPTLTFPLPQQLGFSYTNRFFTNYELTRTTNPFQGVADANPPTEIYLRFRDGSPENDNGAKVYRVRVYMDRELIYDVVGGREPPGVLHSPGASKRDMESRWVDRDASFIYRFAFDNPQSAKRLYFAVEVANDYIVEMSSSSDPNSFEAQLISPGNITDESNRATRRFDYGVLTDETTIGLDLHTILWDTNIDIERAWYMRTFQYPILEGRRSQRVGGAWYIDLVRRLGRYAALRSEYTRIDPFYNAANFIKDDDNEDSFEDAREPSDLVGQTGRNDIDGDRVSDWEDDFLLFETDPPSFRMGLRTESMDFNSNGVPDSDEEDEKPNYRLDYDEGTQGHHTFLQVEVPFLRGVRLIPGYYEKQLIAEKKSARGWYHILSFTPGRVKGFGKLEMRYTLRRSHDIIPDDIFDTRTRSSTKDVLAWQDLLSHIFTTIASYEDIPNLLIRTKFKYQYDALFHTRQRLIDTALINQVRYKWDLSDDFTLTPAFRSDRFIGYTRPINQRTVVDTLRNAYILTLSHRLAEQLQLSAGWQYLTFRDLNEARNNTNRTVFFLELALQGDALGQKVGVLTTFDYVTESFVEPIGGGIRETNIDVRLFLL